MEADRERSAALSGFTEIERLVLRHVRRHPGKSRTEIADELDLSKAMLTKAVAKFATAGIIVEEQTRPREGERGKPRVRLSLREDAFHSVGLYVNNRHFAAVRIDLAGRIACRVFEPLPPDHDAVIDVVMRGLEALIGGTSVPTLGIGHAVPAIVDATGNLFDVTPTQARLPLARIASLASQRFGLPVYVENDAYCLSTHEATGAQAHRRCVFYVTLNFGVGGGMVFDGTLYRGAFNQAANIGALIPETGPRPSLTDLAKHLDVPIDTLSEAFLSELVTNEDPRLLEWIDDRGPRLSAPLASAIQFLNPDVIVLGGFFPREILRRIRDKIDLDVLDVPKRRPLTKPCLEISSTLGPSGIAEAAAALPIAAQLLGRPPLLTVSEAAALK